MSTMIIHNFITFLDYTYAVILNNYIHLVVLYILHLKETILSVIRNPFTVIRTISYINLDDLSGINKYFNKFNLFILKSVSYFNPNLHLFHFKTVVIDLSSRLKITLKN